MDARGEASLSVVACCRWMMGYPWSEFNRESCERAMRELTCSHHALNSDKRHCFSCCVNTSAGLSPCSSRKAT